mmetsp:Transcript_16792/g.68691  ORF Transcript_16792/g.68691 Transcript_16792/m.68691 type:complete len:87 (-) Transcript_16792:882-1142(-)
MSNQLAALDRAMRFFPESADTEIGNSMSRKYKPRNPTVVPASYPVLPSQVFENVAIFQVRWSSKGDFWNLYFAGFGWAGFAPYSAV